MRLPADKANRKLFASLAIALLWALPCSAQNDEARELKVEAAYLYNFFNYITWPGYAAPADLKHPVICVYDNPTLETYLTYVQYKMATERELTVRMLQPDDTVQGCNLLFTHNSDNASVPPIAANILTISDTEGYLDQGGMIELAQENGRIGMKINNSLLEQNGFNVSSRLLGLAQGIK